MAIDAVLTLIASVCLETIATPLAENLQQKVLGDPAQKAFAHALGLAVQKYARQGARLALSAPLLQEDGPLQEKAVAVELARLLQFDGEPDAALIGQRWQAALAQPPVWRDFTAEARLLLRHLQAELMATDLFRPVFQSKSLAEIAANSVVSAEAMAEVNLQLVALTELMETGFGRLAARFQGATDGIRHHIRDFTLLIDEKTRDFVGRQFVFEAIDQFLATHARGYYFVRGDPGIGKTALAAQYVKQSGVIHHFNSRPDGINKADTFLRNVCSQLIAAYDLPYLTLPPEATQDAGFLGQLLEEVSAKLGLNERLVIVVDALDEVDILGLTQGTNPLYLPKLLPQGVYILVTMRKDPITMRIEVDKDTLDIEQDGKHNIADIDAYVREQSTRPGIQRYIRAQEISADRFVKFLVKKSQGNFMYLRYVLPEMADGAYQDLNLDRLPEGLTNYYEDHWQRMKGLGEDDWFDYKLPIVMALTVVMEPVSKTMIADFAKVPDRRRITAVIREWSQFLHQEEVEYEGRLQTRYRIYHASFHDFIARQEEVTEERVSRQAAHKQIADSLWDDLMGGAQTVRELPATEDIDPVRLRDVIIDTFTEEEFRDLVFSLRINYATLEGSGMTGKVISLINYFTNRQEVHRLRDEIRQLRPRIDI